MSKLQHAVEALTNSLTRNPVGRPRTNPQNETSQSQQRIDTTPLSNVARELHSAAQQLIGAANQQRGSGNTQGELTRAAQQLNRLFTARMAREQRIDEERQQREAERKKEKEKRETEARNRNIFETIGNIGNRMSGGLGSGLVANVGHGLTAGIGRMGMVGAIMGGVTALLKGVVEGLVNTIKSVFNVIKGVFDWVLGHMASLHDLIKLSVMGAKMNGGTFSNANTLAARAIQGADNVTGLGLQSLIGDAFNIIIDPQKWGQLAFGDTIGSREALRKEFDSEDGFGALRVTEKILRGIYNQGISLGRNAEHAMPDILRSLGLNMQWVDFKSLFDVQKDGRVKFNEFKSVAELLNKYAKQVGINDLTPRKYALYQEKSNLLSQGIGSTWGEYVLQVLEVLNELGRDLHTRLGSKESFRNSVKDFVDTICNFIKYLGQGGIDRLDSALGYLTNKNGLLADFTWLKNGLLSFADVMFKIVDWFRNSFIGDKLGISDFTEFENKYKDIRADLKIGTDLFGSNIINDKQLTEIANNENANDFIKYLKVLSAKGVNPHFQLNEANKLEQTMSAFKTKDGKEVTLIRERDRETQDWQRIKVIIDGKFVGLLENYGGDGSALPARLVNTTLYPPFVNVNTAGQ